MKGVVFLGDRKLELRDFPDPIPGPRDVILEIKASGMCGSDLHNYRAPAAEGGARTPHQVEIAIGSIAYGATQHRFGAGGFLILKPRG